MNRRILMTGGGASVFTWLAGCVDGPNSTMQRRTDSPGGNRESNTAVTDATAEADEYVDISIVASYPIEGTNDTLYERQTVLTMQDFTSASLASHEKNAQPAYVRVSFTQEAAQRFVEVMNEKGFTDEGANNCRWQQNADDPGWCLYTVVDGEIDFTAAIGNELASAIRTGEFLNNPSFPILASNHSKAEKIYSAIENDSE